MAHLSKCSLYAHHGPIMAPTLAGTSVQSAAPTCEICVNICVLCSLLIMESKTHTHEHDCNLTKLITASYNLLTTTCDSKLELKNSLHRKISFEVINLLQHKI